MTTTTHLLDADCELELEGAVLPLRSELLCILDWVALMGSDVYAGTSVPRGHGEAVIVIPGFLGSLGRLSRLTGWLERIGYDAHGPGFDRNIACPDNLLERLQQQIADVSATNGPVRLIGHSLGGSLARAAAVRAPGMVSHVITLGSPLRSVTAHPVVVELARVLARLTPSRHGEHTGHIHAPTCACELAEALVTPFPSSVRRTAVYTRSDGVVDWRTCIEGDERLDVEVTGTHVGLVVNSSAYAAIAHALATPLLPKDLARIGPRHEAARRTRTRPRMNLVAPERGE